MHHVNAGFPPGLLLRGTDDKVVPPSASMVMYEALVTAGVPVEMHSTPSNLMASRASPSSSLSAARKSPTSSAAT